MQRRDFLAVLSLTVTWPFVVQAQQPKNVARIGFLATGSLESPETRASFDAFREGLRKLGYFEGENIVIEVRAADSKMERFPALVNELIGLKVDIIVALNSLSGRAAKQATSTIPIVVPVMGDPVEDGLVASLARPGGNVTGLTFLGPQLVPKRLALLKEALPSASRVAVLWHPRAYGDRTMDDMVAQTETAGKALGLQLQFVGVQGPDELDRAFSTIGAARVDAVMVFPSPMLFNERTRIVDLGRKLRLPLISQAKEFVELGGLMSYGADIIDFIRRGATYVDKILKGAKPADLPVEQPTKFGLSINLKTAKELGVDIPATLLTSADEVIE
jgi:putative tryptophan/tyrosine transport system substrate-binding protein